MERLSIVIPVKNAEKDIRECLENAKWADEIIIVDDYSTDKTLQICQEYTKKIFQRKMTGFSEQRGFGDQQANGDWILQLDADQRVSPGLKTEIREVLERGTDCDGFMVYKVNTYLGKPMRYCGWRPKVLILYRNGKAVYDGKRVHEKMIVQGKIGHLRNEIIHKSYDSLSEHFARMDLYTSYDAQDLWDRGFRLIPLSCPIYLFVKPLYVFFSKYIKYRGFREGIRGYFISVITAFVVFMNYAKLWEKQKNESKQSKK